MRKKSRIELNNLEIVTILLTLVGNGTEKIPPSGGKSLHGSLHHHAYLRD